MPRNRFTNEQIAFALRQAENGATVDEVCRKMGVSEPTFYRRKKQFVGTPSVKAAVVVPPGCQAAICRGWSWVQFHGSRLSMRRAGWSGSRASMSASHACGSMPLSLAVSISV